MKYDVVVIGGGPAGMMAAGRAAECGAHVLLLEKNATLGKKLLITGGGRSNVTNAEFDQHLFLAKFKDAAKFLFSPLSQFGVQDTLDFFHARGMLTKVEAEKRVFPQSNRAQSVWDTLVGYMGSGQVTVMTSMEVTGLETADGKISAVRIKNGDKIRASAYVLATGGKSRPETGSTGEGFEWLKKIGHTITAPRVSLVPLRIREKWVHQLSGLSFAEAKLTVYQGDEKQESKRGKILFTHVGLSGPLALNMSRNISESLQYGTVKLSIDLRPEKNIGELDKELQVFFEKEKNKQIKNSLGGFVAALLVPVLLKLTKIDPEKLVHSISRPERIRIVHSLKGLSMTVSGLLGADKAIVTSGGVSLEEVDFGHMRSRRYPNLYLVGDVLDIDRPSGGYSLQLCWTTGYVAGTAAANEKIKNL